MTTVRASLSIALRLLILIAERGDSFREYLF